MKNLRWTLLIVLAVVVGSVGAAEAGKRKCADDYRRFCSQWGLETRGLGELHAPARRPTDASLHPRLDQGRRDLAILRRQPPAIVAFVGTASMLAWRLRSDCTRR